MLTILCNLEEFLSLLKKRGLSFPIYGIYFPSPNTWLSNEVCESFPFSKNVDYHMQFLEFISLQKHGLSYEICGISFPSLKTWTLICNFWNYFPLTKKHGQSYEISGISFSSPKTETIICNFFNFFPSPKLLSNIYNFTYFFYFSKNVDYHMQFLDFL